MAVLVLVGFATWLALWLGHDDGIPNPEGAGEWRSVPALLRPLFRRGPGPVLIGTVFLQFAALTLVAVPLLYALGVLATSAAIGSSLIVGSWVFALASWGFVWLRWRRWRARRPDDSGGASSMPEGKGISEDSLPR